MDTQDFMEELFGNKPRKFFIPIWTLQDKKTRRFKSAKKASTYIIEQNNQLMDVYFGCGTQSANLGINQRGSREHISSMPGFYVDVDVAHAVHKKSNLPPTIEDAAQLLSGYGWDPSIVVSSGHGLHAWWLFKEHWTFESEDDLIEWELLSRRLQLTIKRRAEEKLWTIDSTFDATRLLRPPGITNYKDPNNPVPTSVFEKRFSRYEDPKLFDEYLVASSVVQLKTAPARDVVDNLAGDLSIDPMAEPPAVLMDVMMEAEPKFKASWYRMRSDLKDDSPSGYAMSLASYAAAAKWSDQDIANLIIAWYRRHGENMEKAMRLKYLAVTIINAKKVLAQESLNDFEKNIAPAIGTPYQSSVDPLGDKAREHVSTVLNIKIIWFKKFKREGPPWYVMAVEAVLKGKPKPEIVEINFPTQKYITQRLLFADQVFAAIDYYPTIPKTRGAWITLLNYMKAFLILDTVSDESSTYGRLASWLSDYIYGHSPKTTPSDTVKSKLPFVYKKAWYVNAPAFRRWCYTNRGQVDGVEKTELDLKIVGCTKRRVPCKKPDTDPVEYGHIRAWRIPPKIISPADKKKTIMNDVPIDSHADVDEFGDDAPTMH